MLYWCHLTPALPCFSCKKWNLNKRLIIYFTMTITEIKYTKDKFHFYFSHIVHYGCKYTWIVYLTYTFSFPMFPYNEILNFLT